MQNELYSGDCPDLCRGFISARHADRLTFHGETAEEIAPKIGVKQSFEEKNEADLNSHHSVCQH